MFGKCSDFLEKFTILEKNSDVRKMFRFFGKIPDFREKNQIFGKYSDFWKKLRFSENVQICGIFFRLSEKFQSFRKSLDF